MSGLTGFEQAMARIQTSIERSHRAAIVREAELAVERMKADVPVDTGELRASIGWEQSPDGDVVIAARADHAVFVEYGTYNMPARPFFEPNIDIMRTRLSAAVANEVEKRK